MKVLVLYFTQSGQQENIVRTLMKPFTDAGDSVHFERIKTVETYPFPWSAFTFFNAFPETFTQQPLPLQPLSEKAFENYDLVVLGYQPWFLTPSRPISSFLQSADAAKILKGKPVVTILGSRNMWLGAQEKVKKRLLDAGAKLVGHIALVDNSGNLTSLVTILRWMLYGKKEPFWFFPAAGVAEKDIQHTEVFGKMIKSAASKGNFDTLQNELNSEGAIVVKPNLVLMEKRGQRGFGFYSKFILAGGPLGSAGRKRRVYIFMNVLPTAIVLLSPLLFVMSKILLIVKRKELKQEAEYHMQNSFRS
jgi:flavodoxin